MMSPPGAAGHIMLMRALPLGADRAQPRPLLLQHVQRHAEPSARALWVPRARREQDALPAPREVRLQLWVLDFTPRRPLRHVSRRVRSSWRLLSDPDASIGVRAILGPMLGPMLRSTFRSNCQRGSDTSAQSGVADCCVPLPEALYGRVW